MQTHNIQNGEPVAGLGQQFFEPGELDYMKNIGPANDAPDDSGPVYDEPADEGVQQAMPQQAPTADAPDASDAPATAPAQDWDSPDNPYFTQSQETQQALAWAQQQLLQQEATDAYNQLVSSGMPATQAQQTVNAAIQSMAIEQRERVLQQREIGLQQMAKPLYVNQLVTQYATKGVQLDQAALAGFNTPQEMQAYAKAAEAYSRSQTFEQRKNTNTDVPVDAPTGSGGGRAEELTGFAAISAGLREADRRARR